MSWALRMIFLTYPWIFNTGNLPRETSVTLLNTVSHGKRTIYHGESAPCNRTYRSKIFQMSLASGAGHPGWSRTRPKISLLRSLVASQQPDSLDSLGHANLIWSYKYFLQALSLAGGKSFFHAWSMTGSETKYYCCLSVEFLRMINKP